ncbi:MAG: hypothetical protein F4Y91_22720 [Gemmatimonadetes bacterium]|nr:hypothetical protein [Gemmatimonadota bacterium]MXY84789.1 hypothetical protein [Gemmatimonadota bacterium]MYB68977.1 hypothetical protein [Gemmatimonadota bacterium]
MPLYRHVEASGGPDDILVIEDPGMLGQDQPSFEFIDSRTIKAHPLIIEALIADSERLWTLEEILADVEE